MAEVSITILVPHGLDGKGGIERQISYLLRELEYRGCAERIYVFPTRYNWPGWLKHFSVPIRLIFFTWHIFSRKIGIVHANIAPRGSTLRKTLYCAWAKCMGCVCILHLHGSAYDAFFSSRSWLVRHLVKKVFRAADHVVVLGNFWADFATRDLAVERRFISIIRNGVPDTNCQRPPGGFPPLLLFLGEVGKRKGMSVLLQALSEDRLRAMEWSLTVAGNGDIEFYQELARSYEIDNRVTFVGWVDRVEVQSLIDRSDLLVLPSFAENQPVAILEAMARSRPVVATAVGSVPEQVYDGVNGLLVPPGDVEALAGAIRTMAGDAELRIKYGLAGRRIFEENYSIGATATQLCELYRSLSNRG